MGMFDAHLRQDFNKGVRQLLLLALTEGPVTSSLSNCKCQTAANLTQISHVFVLSQWFPALYYCAPLNMLPLCGAHQITLPSLRLLRSADQLARPRPHRCLHGQGTDQRFTLLLPCVPHW